MNSLSWLLYFAEVLPNVSGAIGILSSLFMVFWMAHGITAVSLSDWSFSTKKEKEVKDKIRDSAWNTKHIVAAVSILLVTLLIPSTQTIYMIAGSEAAETAVTSDYGQEIMDDLKAILEIQLDTLKKGDKE